MAQQNWASIREAGSALGMKILLGAYRLGGKPLFQVCLFPVILFYSLFHSTAGQASLQYRQLMAKANPTFPAPRPWHRFRHLWSFANTLIDKLAVWMGRIQPEDVEVHNGQLIETLIREGQGAVLVISHLGNFEVCQAMTHTHPDLQLCVLHHTKNAEKFNRLFDRKGSDSQIRFLQVTELGVGEVMTLSEHISQGHFIAISGDRVPVNNPGRTLPVDFLGKAAPFPVGPFTLAMTLQAPIISLQCLKIDGRYRVYCEQLSAGGPVPRREREHRLQQLVTAYADNLQRHCLMAPWQWYNFYPFWQDEAASDSLDRNTQ